MEIKPNWLSDLQVVILSRGAGTRLRPFTTTRPKALSPVCNVPLLTRLLLQLSDSGIDSVTVSLPVVSQKLIDSVSRLLPLEYAVYFHMSNETLAGSIPAVLECLDQDAQRVLVIYGDSLLRADFSELLREHSKARQRGALCSVLYHQPSDLRIAERDGRTYHGVMSINEEGRVCRFVEKPTVLDIRPGFDLANAAVFVIETSILKTWDPTNGADFSRDLFEKLVREEGFLVNGVSIKDGYRHDAGSVERLYKANMKILNGDWPGFIPGKKERPGIWIAGDYEDKGATLIPPVILGERVALHQGATVGPRAVLGDGCTVLEDAQVSDSVLMSNCWIGANSLVSRAMLGYHCTIGEHAELPQYSALGDYSVVLEASWGRHDLRENTR